jgi:hypothetical protein
VLLLRYSPLFLAAEDAWLRMPGDLAVVTSSDRLALGVILPVQGLSWPRKFAGNPG